MYRTDVQKALEGATITKVHVTDRGDRIIFDCADRPGVTLEAFGDCCSLSWIESLDAPDALLGTVQSVDDIAMPNLGNVDGRHHSGVDQVRYYGLKIVTNRGVCVIDYRNDSNGYYGGSLEVVRS